MFSPDHQLAMVEDRKQRLLHEARIAQLMREADRDRSKLGERLMALVGDLMISGGQKLKAQSEARNAVRTPLQEMPYP